MILRSFKDQLNREIQISFPPKKIISLVPSQTELLFDLGLNDEVIGITRFCIHPEAWFRTKTRIGGTKKLNLEKIESLQPDLIIGNKEENEKDQIEELEKKFPVWMSDVKNLYDAYEMISAVGELVGKVEQAEQLVSQIKVQFEELRNSQVGETRESPLPESRFTIHGSRRSCAYLIWYDPMLTVGSDTFIHAMLTEAGFENVFLHKTRYPEISMQELKERNPVFLLLSSEPYPFKQKHLEFFQKELPESKILLVDGELFSWYGSRLLKVPGYLLSLSEKESKS